MKLITIVGVSSILLLASCSNELPVEQPSNFVIPEETSSLKDGLEEALNMIALMENGQTRSHSRTIHTINKLNVASTRSE